MLKGNEHEFFRRMAGFLNTVEKQQQEVLSGSVHSGGSDKKQLDEIRRSSTVQALTSSPAEAEPRQGCKRLGSSGEDDKVESDEILLTLELTQPRRI